MGSGNIVQYKLLSEAQKDQLVEILVEGFGHLMTFTKDKNQLNALFRTALHPDFVYAYVEQDRALGLLGLATNQIRAVKLNSETCKDVLGKKGILICKQMNAIFQSQVVKEDTDLYIDFLATAKDARGKGIATALLNFSFQLPGYKDYYIEVFSKNENAKRLYESIGFSTIKKSYFSPAIFLHYGYPIKMKKK